MKIPSSVGTIIFAASLLFQLNPLCFHSHGAAGDVDLSFDPGSGVNGPVNAVAVQADGKVIIGGDFTTVRGLARTNLARLNSDGSGDPTFNPGIPYDVVASLALQPDGKVLVGSQLVETVCDEFDCFADYQAIVTRLDPNGSLDAGFSRATVKLSNPNRVNSLVVQPDGKVLVGGSFNMVNGTNRSRIARLNADGSLDNSFNTGSGPDGWPYVVPSIALQTDGKILVGGGFSTFDGTNRKGLARLDANGSLDHDFNPGTELGGTYPRVWSVVVQPDGKVLVGGYFTNAHGNCIVRFNANGSLDNAFNSDASAYYVGSVGLQPDGKVLVAGQFTTTQGTSRYGSRRLNPDGSLDTAFDFSPESASGVDSSILQSDGKVLVAGRFASVNLMRLHSDGGLDPDFNPGRATERVVSAVVALPDGKVLIGGVFTFINGTNRYGSARLNADGSLDRAFISAGFHPVIAITNMNFIAVRAVVVLPDGKVLLGGNTSEIEFYDEFGIPYYSHRAFLTRVHADGSSDSSFPIARGEKSFDSNLDPPQTAALAVQPDGKVLFAGPFSVINGSNRSGMARFSTNGILDSSFNPAFNARIAQSLALQPDGKVLVGGGFGYGPPNRIGIARLNPNGSLDSTFNPGSGVGGSFNPAVLAIHVQPDGRILIGGLFTNFNGTNRNHIARLNADGSLDSSYNPSTGANGTVRSIKLQSDGNVLIGGDFTTVNGVARAHIARLYGNSVAPSLSITRVNASVLAISWPSPSTGFTLQQNTNSIATVNWSNVLTTPTDNGTIKTVIMDLTTGNRFYRLKNP